MNTLDLETIATSIDKAMPVGSIVTNLPSAARLLEARKIDYYCHGEAPLADACARSGSDLDDVVRALSSLAVTADATAATSWSDERLIRLGDHIIETHHRFTRGEIEALPALSERIRDLHLSGHPELTEVHRIASALQAELFPHMMKEEQILFPFVSALEDAVESAQEPPIPFFGTVRNPIAMMIQEHDAAGEMLEHLRRVTKNYALPADTDPGLEGLFRRLMALEEDLHFHIHLENNIYFPRAIDLEVRARA